MFSIFRILIIIPLVVVVLFGANCWSLILAEGTPPPVLDVTAATTLTASDGPYVFSGITVEPAGELVIQSGTTILLTKQAVVAVKGRIRLLGTQTKPVVVTAQDPYSPWQGVVIDPAATLTTLIFVTFRYFTDPIQVAGGRVTLHDLTVQDGVQNTLQVTQHKGSDIQLYNMTFLNALLGTEMKESGLRLLGEYGRIFTTNITFRDAQYKRESTRTGIEATGTIGSMTAVGTHFPYGCSPQYQGIYDAHHAWLNGDTASCTSPRIPVVFVPGYGTSINLASLTNPDLSVTKTAGWRFISKLTPAYDTFLDTLDKDAVPYVVAYYDWRLPAAEAAMRYLVPAINQAMQQYGVDEVNIVAHSFGGLVARSYLQGDQYQGNVAQFIEVGTPNLGAAKAYQVWEGGQIPEDWQVIDYLVRYYQHRSSVALDHLQAVRTYFPSAHDLLPLYPLLLHSEEVDPESIHCEKNTALQRLQALESRLYSRSQVTTIRSAHVWTEDQEHVGAEDCDQVSWPDGDIIKAITAEDGDGTVPGNSVRLSGANNLETSGLHSDLMATAADTIVSSLYGTIAPAPAQPTLWQRVVSFFFDCPVIVTIVLPDGSKRSSTDLDGPGQVGNVIASPDLLWMVVPEQQGNYLVTIKALADTPVTYWINTGLDTTVSLRQSQSMTFTYAEGTETSGTLPPVVTAAQPGVNGSALQGAQSIAPVIGMGTQDSQPLAAINVLPRLPKTLGLLVPPPVIPDTVPITNGVVTPLPAVMFNPVAHQQVARQEPRPPLPNKLVVAALVAAVISGLIIRLRRWRK